MFSTVVVLYFFNLVMCYHLHQYPHVDHQKKCDILYFAYYSKFENNRIEQSLGVKLKYLLSFQPNYILFFKITAIKIVELYCFCNTCDM